ncbi:MAG TPA: DUF72 domain-containing protein [Gemmatimonadaceae bacterium]|nr:DUF72 domain-containing protein [Gemmatimonadaceae bacterium]
MGSFTAAPLVVRGSRVSVGVASWTDPTFTARGVFYPDDARTPEKRLRYYASRFPVVEVDSTYYALPTVATAKSWVDRTPAHFAFDVKAFALMTGHPAEVSRLPATLREALPEAAARAKRVTAEELPPSLLDEAWRIFADACRPLHDAGKLGAVFLQYAPWIAPTKDSPAMLERAVERLAGLPLAVEFRNAGWMTERLRQRTWELLARLGISYVAVDEPQGTPTSVPPLVHTTQRRLAVIRLHGQRADTWAARGVPAVEKYRYLYSTAELDAWAERIVEAAATADNLHVIFNNCYANYGAVNAAEMIRKLDSGIAS